MDYFSYSYWEPMRGHHYVGWVYAKDYTDAFDALLTEFKGLKDMGAPFSMPSCKYHPDGEMWMLKRALRSGLSQPEMMRDWKRGTAPTRTYLFMRKDTWWIWMSPIWSEVPASVWTRELPDGRRFTFAFVIPPAMEYDVYPQNCTPRRVLETDGKLTYVSRYPTEQQ